MAGFPGLEASVAGRTENMQAHRFAVARLTAALAAREADPDRSPVRRSAAAAFAGVMLAVVALAAVAAYGVLRPGDDTGWRDGRSVIIERETGARFIYRDGVLHPTLNQASALLILGSPQPATAIVSHASLAGVPRGAPLGIPGAPDPLPAAGDLLTGDWTLCSRPGPESLLAVGVAVPGEPLGLGQAALVVDPDGADHLLWNGHRYAIPRPGVVLAALGWRDRTPVPAAAALLNAVPAGDDLAPPAVAGRGHPSAFTGHQVGDVVVTVSQGGVQEYGLVQPDGLAAITEVQADLLLAEPGAQSVPLTPAQVVAAPAARSLVPTGDAAPPASVPALVDPGARGGLCASFVDAATPPRLALAPTRPAAPAEMKVTGAAVDWVAVPPGRGSIVDSRASATAPSGQLGVVSDLGLLFPVPSTAVLATLGFGGVAPHVLPSALVALLPRGNALDPAAALSTPD
jgi:type VII secretion protein EccB